MFSRRASESSHGVLGTPLGGYCSMHCASVWACPDLATTFLYARTAKAVADAGTACHVRYVSGSRSQGSGCCIT